MIVVPPEGPIDAPIVLVGEAPGRHEAEKLRPFVGASGRLLRDMLSRVGIVMGRTYITNVVKERPPNNDISRFIKLTSKGAKTTPQYDEYEQRLKEELSKTTANVIVAVGAVALWALCRKTGIMKWRGSVLESTLLPGRKVIPIIHPSAALRQFIFRYYILNDLKRVARESKTSEIKHPERRLLIAKSPEEAIHWISLSRRMSTIAFDIEVINDELACFSIAVNPYHCMTIPLFSPTKGQLWSAHEEYEILMELGRLLTDEKVLKIGQNMIFDTGFMFRKYGIVTKNIADTMIAHAILYPDFPKGLDFLTSMYTDEPYYKDEGKMWKRVDSNDEQFWIYNAKDSAVTFEVWGRLSAELFESQNIDTYRRQVALIEPLLFLTHHGIRVDIEGLHKASADTEVRIKELEKELEEVVGHKINPRSVNDLKQYFYIEKKYHPYVNRSTGAITVDRNALKRLAGKGDPAARILLELRKLQKMKSTYYDVKLSKDGRLRAAYNPVGTESGRLSSSKTFTGEGSNMQNQPSEMKRFLLADAGYIAYDADLSQAENRVVAYVAPEPKMIKAFEDKIDIHSQTGALIFGGTVEQIKQEHKDGITIPIGDGTHTKRDFGKRANHGLNYGLGYRTFALYYEIPEKEAKEIVTAYHTVYPGIDNYHRWVRESLARDRTLTNLMGRRRLFLDRWGETLFKEAYSFIPQSTVADIINRAFKLIYDDLPDVVLLNQVHDSIVFEIPASLPIERHLELLNAVVERMTIVLEAWGRKFSIPVEVKAGLNLGEMTKIPIDDNETAIKKLEPIYEKAKRLD